MNRGRVIVPSFWKGKVRLSNWMVSAEVQKELRERKERTRCTVCGDPQPWYRLEPGTGRCVRCQP